MPRIGRPIWSVTLDWPFRGRSGHSPSLLFLQLRWDLVEKGTVCSGNLALSFSVGKRLGLLIRSLLHECRYLISKLYFVVWTFIPSLQWELFEIAQPLKKKKSDRHFSTSLRYNLCTIKYDEDIELSQKITSCIFAVHFTPSQSITDFVCIWLF